MNQRSKCPDCGSSDGLAYYENASHCFSCHVHKNYDSVYLAPSKALKVTKDAFKMYPDYTPEIPVDGWVWLSKAGITEDQAKHYQIGYSPRLKRIILPVFDAHNDLVAYQARALGDSDAKYLTFTSTSGAFFASDHNSTSFVVVEDILSAIKVGTAHPTIALLGTNLHSKLEYKLSRLRSVLLWLDGDSPGWEAAYSIWRQLRTRVKIDIIQTSKDPKCYPLEQIKDILSSTGYNNLQVAELTNMDIRAMTDEPRRENGLKWRLERFNEVISPLILGDFIVVAARPEVGKTTFLASEVTKMAAQLPKDKKVLWFNNEWTGYQIRNYLYRAALNKTDSELGKDLNKAASEYLAELGAIDKIQIFDVFKRSYKDIETIIKSYNVGLIVIDMLDNVMGFNKSGIPETTDEKFGRLYHWASNLSCQVAPVIVTSQVPRLAESKSKEDDLLDVKLEKRYPPMERLVGSGTLKQGAARVIIMIGKDENTGDARFIHIPKNKLTGKDGYKCELAIDRQRARYNDNSNTQI